MLDLPLIDRSTHSSFTRKSGGRTVSGRVFPQFINQDRKDAHHSSTFYVEFPQETFHELSAKKLMAVLADGAPCRTFTHPQIARVLESIDTRMNLERVLPKLAPPNP